MSFEKNLKLFVRDNPECTSLIKKANLRKLKWCQTYEGEPNLVDTSKKRTLYIHAPEGAALEADTWAEKLRLNSEALVVYGLGLGYYAAPLKQWLHASNDRRLIFLEDDPRIIARFLEREQAGDLLSDPQIMIKWIPEVTMDADGWLSLCKNIEPLQKMLAASSIQFSSLHAYFLHRFAYFDAMVPQLLSHHAQLFREMKNSFLTVSHQKIQNFYANIFRLDRAFLGYQLAQALHDIPVLICGAGPSITAQLKQIEALQHRVLIGGAGSAVNVLTNHSIFPHFGGGVDPTSAQASRQLTSFAYDMPLFYKNTFYEDALAYHHGPLIYVSLTGVFPFFEWFDKQLGIHEPTDIYSGISTSNFLVEMAGFLGCQPIVLAGIDLAYTENKRYAAGVRAHPSDDPSQQQALTAKEELTLPMAGLKEKEVYTTQVWFLESLCMADFHIRYPNLPFYNATEGGMPIPTVPNITLQQASKLLEHPFDPDGYLHGVIHNNAIRHISRRQITEAAAAWKQSLRRCLQLLKQTKQEKLDVVCKRLKREPAYDYLLKQLLAVYDDVYAWTRRKAAMASKMATRRKGEQEVEQQIRHHLIEHVETHLKLLQRGHKLAPSPAPLGKTKKVLLPPATGKGKRRTRLYRNGAVQVEAYLEKGELSGPWSYFADDGTLLYRSHFVRGKRDGPAIAYTREGSLYSTRTYKEGKLHGIVSTYWNNGTLKTKARYRNGKLHGTVELFYENGKPKKVQQFKDGELVGSEKAWTANGKLSVEAAKKEHA